MKAMLLLRLLQLRIVERYPTGPEFDDMEPLEEREGEPFIIRRKGEIEEERMMDNELGPSNRKHPREADAWFGGVVGLFGCRCIMLCRKASQARTVAVSGES